MIENDSAFTSLFVPHEYSIDFWLNGGYFPQSPQLSLTVESGSIEIPLPEKAGADFEGWYLSADYSGEAVGQIVCQCKDIALYAKWSDGSYTVRYELNGGLLHMENPTGVTSADEIPLADPVRKGYLFLGWYDRPQNGERYYSVGGENAANLTLYALWQQSQSIFTVRYELNGGTLDGENPVSVGAGELYELLSPSKPGYEFVGWNTQADGEGEFCTHLYGIDRDMQLYAIFQAKEYLIRYEYEGTYEGEKVNPNHITYGQSITLLPVYLYGHRFLGWFDAESGGTLIEQIDEGNLLSLSVLYARFVPDQFQISLDAGEGQFEGPEGNCSSYTYTMEFGETFRLPDCRREGYDFLGWLTETGKPISQIDNLNIRDMNLMADWRLSGLNYRITYELNGGSLSEANPESVLSGQSMPLYEPYRDGYLFLGWYDNPDGAGDRYYSTPEGREEDLTLYAVWQEIKVNGSSENFTYEKGAESVTITGYTGERGENIEINIPAIIEGLPVTAIEWKLGDTYRRIVLPDGLLRLGDRALSLKTIEPLIIPASVVELGRNCFIGCSLEVYFAEGSKLEVIGEYAFFRAAIKNVLVLPLGVKEIGNGAFDEAEIPGIILPDGLEIIGSRGLYNFWKTIYIPASVRYVGNQGIYCDQSIYTGLTEEQAKKFDPNWYDSRKLLYAAEPVTVTLNDGEKSESLTGHAFALPFPQKNGYTFIGWKMETGEFADIHFIPEADTVLTAVYEVDNSEDGRDRSSVAVLKFDQTRIFYGMTGSEFYFRIDTDVPVTINVLPIIDRKGVRKIMTRWEGKDPYYQYQNMFEYMPGEVVKIQLKDGCLSEVVQLQLQIIKVK